MSKTRSVILSALVAAFATSAPAAIVGPDAGECVSGRPALQVQVSGFKRATGTVSLALYASDGYLEKGRKLRKVEVPVSSSAPLDICIAVPGPGRYAVAVHHDLNTNGGKDGSDGIGYSGNPHLSIVNLRPSFGKTSIEVGTSTNQVGVQMQYRRGLSVGPVKS